MIIKSTSKTIQPKKRVERTVPSKQQNYTITPSEKKVSIEMIEIHKHLRQIEKIIASLQKELEDIQRLIGPYNVSQTMKNTVPHVEKVVPEEGKTPAKKGQVQKKFPPVRSKVPVVQTTEKTIIRSTDRTNKSKSAALSGTKKTHNPGKMQGKKVYKLRSKTPNETRLPIPDDIPDRITALTSQKKITQTQFGKEADLSQKVIYEISERKLKEIDPTNIWKIVNVLKKYESA